MKFSKSVIAVLTAVLLVIVPQLYCFAEVGEGSRTGNAVELISDGFSVDNSNITPDSTFKFTYKLKNPSKSVDIKNVNMRLSGGDALSISNDVDTIYKDIIAKNSTAEFSKNFYCSASAETGMYPITVSITYEYTVDGEDVQGTSEFSYTVKVTKPAAAASTSAGTPVITSSFSVNKNAIYPGDTFKLSFSLKNTSTATDISNVNVRLLGGDAFSISKDVDTIYKQSIKKGAAAKLSKNFVCAKNTEAGMHPITVSVTYEYTSGGEKQQGTAEFSFTVQTSKKSGKKTTASLTPQLLISGFSYGGKEINGGEIFNLNFTVKNNSETTKIQNIVIKLSGGECFVVADGTDTVTMKSLGANASANMSKSFKCLSSAPSGVYPVTASVSYEYIEDSAKQTATSELTMSIPVVQPDRVQFQSVDLADKTVTVSEETDCAFSIINTGQTKLSNGVVKLLDEDKNELASAFVGNIEAGAQFSSNYTLPVTFEETGSKKLKLVFEYENENSEKKSIEQEFNVTVEEYFDPYEDVDTGENIDDTEMSGSALSTPVIIGICVGGAVLIIVLAVVIKKVVKRKKAKKGSEGIDEEI
ncbi:MAG: hypothetical protein ACI4XC_03815 [Eubacterium sp.]